ncbi:hypothetical protein Lal_00042227, partial [Lupinus albus]
PSSQHPGFQRNVKSGGSSSTQGGIINVRKDPYYTSALHTERFTKFIDRKQTFIRYAITVWMVEQGFQFLLDLEAQGANKFLELNGNIFPSLVRELYSNFQYKDGNYVSFVKGKLISLNDELFLEVGGLASDGSPLGGCNNELWNLYDTTEMYLSCLRRPYYYVQGEFTKVGSMTIENNLFHYLITYVLVQRNTNHAQPTGNDLKLMYVVKEGIMVNWSTKTLKVMYSITSSSSRFLTYEIFTSSVIEHVGIYTCNDDLNSINPREHLIDDSLIHKMSIYKYGGEDYHNTIENSDEDEDAIPAEQTQASEHDDAPTMPQEQSLGLAHFDDMEQCFNERIDNGMKAMENRMKSMEDRLVAE